MFARQALRTAVRARAPYRFAPLVVPSASFSSAASLSKSFVTRRGAKRGISSTPALEGAQEPTQSVLTPTIARTFETYPPRFSSADLVLKSSSSGKLHAALPSTPRVIVHEYPEEHEFVEGDLGHSTDGPEVDVGKHNQRTLASFSMTNKVCVITGAARGLGNLFARTFAESGSNAIVILDLDQGLAETAAKDLVDWFEEHGQAEKGEISAIGLGCDVADEKNVQDCFAKVVEKYGRIDVLVTAAGIVENFPAQDYPTEKFRKLMAINAAKDMMRRDGECPIAAGSALLPLIGKSIVIPSAPGSIVMIGSMSGACVNVPQPQAPYNASKAAVRHMASSLAVEWATRNIRVNAISPGYMATALTRVILDRDPVLKETWENLTPMGRIGEPEDLKGAVIYLASDASGFTTGTDLRVDGGYTLT
ncbi:BQ5605_C018g08711 [Microbotryum silenes-dioicae]|uniref:BQ5605_C018g08711 protein n=1 Tax=Microbotryum silenes-dioicae TaxID=796604 RepID=A0A2X0NUL8_9BASI|nr:BQ5605_C018g08711 [Microbotryum silenes-dioicae]